VEKEDTKGEIKTHKDLEVWSIGIELVEAIYKSTKAFPKEELYGLATQMRRAAISVPSNIAEGAARNSRKEFVQFLYISLGSLAELETQVIIAQRLGFISQSNNIMQSIVTFRRKLLNLIKYLKNK
jgi:four helix bundle protein